MRVWWQTLRVLVAGVVLVGAPATAAAQQNGLSGFVPVPGGQVPQERLPATPLVFGAYAFVWVALIVYVFLLWRRLDRVERELAEVSRRAHGKSR